MQEEFNFYEGENDNLLKTYNGKGYNEDYVKKLFNIKLITNRPQEYKDYRMDIVPIQECINYINKLDIVSVDIETTRKYNGSVSSSEGLDPHLSKIVMFQIGDLKTQFVIDTRDTDITELVKLLPNKIVVGHNLKFEYKHILNKYGVRLNKLYDTMIAEKVLYNGHRLKNGLKDLNERYLGIKVNKATRLGFLYIKNRRYKKEEITYGAEDILYPLLIKDLQKEDIFVKNLENCLDLEFDFVRVLAEIEHTGLGIDQKQWIELYQRNLIRFKEEEEKLNQWVLKHNLLNFIDAQTDLFESDKVRHCLISWTSSQQVIKLFKFLKICPLEKSKTTKKMAYTVEAKQLEKSFNGINKNITPQKEELVKQYLKYKELEQSVTTFGEGFLKNVNPVTGRLHSDYNQIINTGRISSSGPNLQNIPADKEFRLCFNCSDDKNIINADYSG